VDRDRRLGHGERDHHGQRLDRDVLPGFALAGLAVVGLVVGLKHLAAVEARAQVAALAAARRALVAPVSDAPPLELELRG
jgi:hypothetical protein